MAQFKDFGILTIDNYQDDKEMAITSAIGQNLRALWNSLVLCVFANPPPAMITELIQTATGMDYDIEKLKILAERIYMIKRLFNLKMGITPADDRIPKILLEPKDEGNSADKSPNFQQLKQAYYKFRDFDSGTGYPSQAKLKTLGLDNL